MQGWGAADSNGSTSLVFPVYAFPLLLYLDVTSLYKTPLKHIPMSTSSYVPTKFPPDTI